MLHETYRSTLSGEIYKLWIRQRLHETGSVWNRYEIGTDKPCVCLALNGSTYEGDPIQNRIVPVSNRSRVNRVDPYHSRSDPELI